MKKMLVMAALLAFTVPAFAGEDCDKIDCHAKYGQKKEFATNLTPEMKAKMEAQRAERRARKAAFEQKEDRLERLVEKYKKAKAGSKKQAELRAEIGQELESVREEQLKMRAEKLAGFEKRLAVMKESLAKEQEEGAKEAWINRMTDLVIAEDGDLEDALEREGHIFKGPKAPHFKGPRGQKGPRVELPVEPKPAAEVK
ncbi:MAG: hypothetical protein IJ016_03840 [Elusimicrobiaceae bacterium]|nr:hypothetical protein [Elusimicrobiaceae bacterium]